jgi:hypothetical protein
MWALDDRRRVTHEARPELRVRLADPDDPSFPGVDAVVRSGWVDERHEHAFCEFRVAVVPGGDGVELLVPADTDAKRIGRLRRLVEFDVAMARRFGAATAGHPAPRTDDRLAELSSTLGNDAVRVATRGLVYPDGGSVRSTFG